MLFGLRDVVIGRCGVVLGDLADGVIYGVRETGPGSQAGVAQALDEQAGDADQDHLGGWLGVNDALLGGDQGGQERGIPHCQPGQVQDQVAGGFGGSQVADGVEKLFGCVWVEVTGHGQDGAAALGALGEREGRQWARWSEVEAEGRCGAVGAGLYLGLVGELADQP